MIGNRTLADQTNMFCRVGVLFLTRRWRYKVVGTWFCGECHLFQASWFLTERHWLSTAAHLWERGGWYSIYYDFFCTGTRTKPSFIGVLALEAKPMEKQLFWMRTFYGRLPYITCGMGCSITSTISYRCPWRKVALAFFVCKSTLAHCLVCCEVHLDLLQCSWHGCCFEGICLVKDIRCTGVGMKDLHVLYLKLWSPISTT